MSLTNWGIKYPHVYEPVIYLHTDVFKCKFYKYTIGLNGKYSWYPYKEHDSGLLAIKRVYDSQWNLIDKNFEELTLSPRHSNVRIL